MKTTLLILAFLGALSLNAQQTHQIFWQIGVNGDDASLTIDVGDTVEWIWNDALPHTVTSLAGSTETFNSGTVSGMGDSFSVTFTLEGVNDYQCNFHPGSMFGTITVLDNLGVDDMVINSFKLFPNPSSSSLNLSFSLPIAKGNIHISDMLGRSVLNNKIDELNEIQLDISNLKSGVYFIEVQSANGTNKKRFIKN